MAHGTTIDVQIEAGAKRAIAYAVEWPGWCRIGRDEAAALQTLLRYGERYARVVGRAQVGFIAPPDEAALRVVERVPGNADTDFGVPVVITDADRRPWDEGERHRSTKILHAYWRAFDRAVERAQGKELRLGPRGGGRELAAIIRHVADADESYLKRLAQKPPRIEDGGQGDIERMRDAIEDALNRVLHEELPAQGPRGGKVWTPRYFVRRVGLHVLDHAWEIEDRVVEDA
jgi:hypothetical protein